MKPVQKRSYLAATSLVVAFACSPLVSFAGDSLSTAPSLADLLQATPNAVEGSGISEARYSAITETARTRGNSAGLAWQSAVIRKRLESMASSLDQIYNFGALMMEGNVVPPVMSKAVDVYDQQSDDVIRIVGENYTMRQRPRFAYVAPSWRGYLSFAEYTFDASVPPLVTPQGPKEAELWAKSLEEGYKMGIEQANKILDVSFARLKADFEGMRLYRELLRRGMVTKPYVSAGHYGVTGDKTKSLNIGESLLRISVTPEFVMEKDSWSTTPDGQAAELLKAAAKSTSPGGAQPLSAKNGGQ